MSSAVFDGALASRAKQMWRVKPGRKVLIASAATVAAVAVAIPVTFSHGGHSGPPTGPGAAAGEATYNGLTLSFPASWHAVRPTFATGAMMDPLGWITNARPGPQCTGHSCHGPVTHLSSGVVQISLETGGGSLDFTKQLHINTDLAGLPAQRTDGTEVCDPSAVTGFSILATETPTSVVRLTACFGPQTSTQQGQVRRMLDTASYRQP